MIRRLAFFGFLLGAIPALGQIASAATKMDPATLYQKTEAVFQMYPVHQEASASEALASISKTANLSGSLALLKYVDPKNQFRRFFSVEGMDLVAFKDRDAKQVVDFRVTTQLTPLFLRQPLVSAGQPLNNLRIALDPGHMGGTYWDRETGKYAQDSAGHVISEGLINLQTALLVKQELEALGATVMITRNDLVPVSTMNPADMDLSDVARHELRSQSLEDWFQALLELGTLGATEAGVHQKMQHLGEEGLRINYFIEREDLDARARKIIAFHPDLTLIIHYDSPNTITAKNVSNLIDAADITRVYVPGSFQAEEFSTSDLRGEIAAQILSPERFRESVKVATAISQSIAHKLNVHLVTDEAGTVMVTPGVLARNLRVSRKITVGLVAYAECLMYGNTTEFHRLLAQDDAMVIGGKSYAYSQRLKDVASAIRDGIVSYYGTAGL